MSDRDSPELTQVEREVLRRHALAVLATAPTIKHSALNVLRELQGRGLQHLSEDAVHAALHFLAGLNLASAQRYWLGATLRYQVTSTGILAHERDDDPETDGASPSPSRVPPVLLDLAKQVAKQIVAEQDELEKEAQGQAQQVADANPHGEDNRPDA